MTHEYTLLLGATVLPDGRTRACEAIAWASGTILALGTDAEVRAISRGDSQVLRFDGAYVLPIEGPLEVGGPADLLVLEADPRETDPRWAAPQGAGAARLNAGTGRLIAEIRGGHVVGGIG